MIIFIDNVGIECTCYLDYVYQNLGGMNSQTTTKEIDGANVEIECKRYLTPVAFSAGKPINEVQIQNKTSGDVVSGSRL